MEQSLRTMLACQATFTFKQAIISSVVIACIFPILLIAVRAINFSSKLPGPFKSLCLFVLLIDVVLAVGTAAEPWLSLYTNYQHDVGDLGCLLLNTVTTLITLERASALQFPLKYIACSSNLKLTYGTTVTLVILETVLYAVVRLLPCFVLKSGGCDFYLVHYILVLQLTLCVIATTCFVMVVLQMVKNKRKHTRRVTRMGLPISYASNTTAAHVSATLFGIFPTMLFTTLFSILSVHRCRFSDATFLAWCSILSRVVIFLVHGTIFNVWFDEGRLHFLTLISPFGTAMKARADEMRIQVYNIVIAEAFDESTRQCLEGQQRLRHFKTLARVASGERGGRARRPKNSDKFNDIRNISEATTSV